jgi:hypothetical protein
MAVDTTQALVELAKLVLLPALGFLAGFVAQWLLQARKSRDELLRALAERRADALCQLWELTTLPVEITVPEAVAGVSASACERLDHSILNWYTKQAGALYLSWPATQLLFRLLDLLRSQEAHKVDLESAVSVLRSRLKLDCGIYSSSEAKRQLVRPRPAPWKANPLTEPADPDGPIPHVKG